MAAHSGILVWEMPWWVEPGKLQSMGWQRVGLDRVTEHTLQSQMSAVLEDTEQTEKNSRDAYIGIIQKKMWG